MRAASGPNAFAALLLASAAAWLFLLAAGPIFDCLAQLCPPATAAATRATLLRLGWAVVASAAIAFGCGFAPDRVARVAGLALLGVGVLSFRMALWLAFDGASTGIFGVEALVAAAGAVLLVPPRAWFRRVGAPRER